MNLQQIEYVLALSELRNFGQAAKKCFISQSTLSTMVARYEEELGITIFDRSNKPVTISQEGEQIIRQLKVISKELSNLTEVINSAKGNIAGEIKIGVIPTIAPYLLPIFLNDFIGKLPNVKFKISEITTDSIIEGLASRDLDIGIAAIPLKQADLVEHPLYKEPFLLYDRSNTGLKNHFNIKEIDINRLWLLEEGHCMRSQTETICGLRKKRTINTNLEYRSGTISTLLRFVKKYDGITLLPYLSTIDFGKKDLKYLKEFKSPTPVRSVGLIVHKHFVRHNLLEMLHSEIKKQIDPLIGKANKKQNVVSPV